ncbi:hypothetical protein KR026_008246, partial [Drosophila bipectinata]
ELSLVILGETRSSPPLAGPIIAKGLEGLGVCGTARSLSLNLKKSRSWETC